MSASPSYGERPHMQGAFRRSFTLPARQLSVHEKAGLDGSDANADILYSHPIARIIKFSPPTDSIKSTSKAEVPADTDYPVDTVETLPWRSRTETLAASGSMIIEKVRGSTNFLKCQDIMHAILRNSQCWCVDGESKFVLRVRKFQYYRIELPSTTEEDKAKVEELKKVFPTVLRYERTPCPFIRAFTVELPDDAITPRRKGPWKRRDSSQPNTPDTDTETPPLRRANPTRSWSLRSPPTSYPKNAPGSTLEDERGRPGSSSGLYRRGSPFETYRNSSPAGYVPSEDGTDSEYHGSEHDGELGATTDRSQSASPRKHFELLQSNSQVQQTTTDNAPITLSTNLPTQTQGANENLERDPERSADSEQTADHNLVDENAPSPKNLGTVVDVSGSEAIGKDPMPSVTEEKSKTTIATDVSSSEESPENVPRTLEAEILTHAPSTTEKAVPYIQTTPATGEVDLSQEAPLLKEQPESSSDSETSDSDDSVSREVSPVNPSGNTETGKGTRTSSHHTQATVEPQSSSAESESESESQSESESGSGSGSEKESQSQSEAGSRSESELSPSPALEPRVRNVQDSVQSCSVESLSTSTPVSSSESEPAIEHRYPGHLREVTQPEPSPQNEIQKTGNHDQLKRQPRPSTPVLKSNSIPESTIKVGLSGESSNVNDSDDDDDNISTVSSNDSFHTMASPRKGLSRAESLDTVPNRYTGYRSTFASTTSQHKRDVSEVTVKASNVSDSASSDQRWTMQEDSAESQASDLLSTGAYKTSGVEVEPVGMQGQEGLRERLRARRSFSPLPPASTIFNDGQIRHDSGNGHMTKVILQKLIVAPIEVAVMFVHVLARIAGGATVNDLLSGELFKRPEHHRRLSEFADQLSGRSTSDTEDDYGVPVRGRRRSTEMRVAMVLDEENEDNVEDVD